MQPMDKVVPPSALLGRAKLHLLWFASEGAEDVVDQCDLEWLQAVKLCATRL